MRNFLGDLILVVLAWTPLVAAGWWLRGWWDRRQERKARPYVAVCSHDGCHARIAGPEHGFVLQWMDYHEHLHAEGMDVDDGE